MTTQPITATPAQARAGLRGINRARRLFIVPCGAGVTCLGFDVAARKTDAVAQWLRRPELAAPKRRGTVKAWRAYQAAMAAGREHNARTGERASFELDYRLKPYEGHRVEVTAPDGERSRFWVGKSTGWAPCHLEIATRRSHGGPAAFIPQGAAVRLVAYGPR